MKTISIKFNTSAATIPLNYHHQVQSLIYNLLSLGGGGEMHDHGLVSDDRHYKLFTFSSMRGGRIQIRNKSIYFEDRVYLDVRSIRADVCEALVTGLERSKGLLLHGQPLTVGTVQTDNRQITADKLQIKMLSPLTIHTTDEGDHTRFLNPLELNFENEINSNFIRKYYAFYGENPSSRLLIKVRKIGIQDRYITLYKKASTQIKKDIYVTGWRGEYEIASKPEYLNFLYYSGLGAKNSSGFGMFEPILLNKQQV